MNSLNQVALASGNWVSKLLLLMMDNFGDRYKRSKLAGLLSILEPVGVIALISMSRFLSAAIAPPFGSSMALFIATGIIPYYIFLHVSMRIRGWDFIQRFPGVTNFDILLSQVASEVIMKTALLAALYFLFWLDEARDAFPQDPVQCMLALSCLGVLGVGIGLINVFISSWFMAWTFIYGIVARGMMLFSGIFSVLDFSPLAFRDFTAYNPVAQGISWFRYGHYQNYPTFTLDIPYLLYFTVFAAIIGWLLEFQSRKARAYG